jgi:hypothetical protein
MVAARGVVSLRQLQELILQDTGVTDVALKALASLKKLKTVYLNGTKVTAAGMADLKKALPECEVTQIWVE